MNVLNEKRVSLWKCREFGLGMWHRKEKQTAVVWTCLPFSRSGQNYLAKHSERGKKKDHKKIKRWEDNIREWTSLELAKSQRQWGTEKKSGGNWL